MMDDDDDDDGHDDHDDNDDHDNCLLDLLCKRVNK